MNNKFDPPRTRAEMVADCGPWIDQKELVVIPMDLLRDLMRCAGNGTEAYPDWKTEARQLGQRAMEIRNQRDEMAIALMNERREHERTRTALADLRKELREIRASVEDEEALHGGNAA